MNILLACTKHIEGDKKRIRTLASMGSICLMLFILTFCLSVVILYNLSGKVRLLEYENRILKEMMEDTPLKTGLQIPLSIGPDCNHRSALAKSG